MSDIFDDDYVAPAAHTSNKSNTDETQPTDFLSQEAKAKVREVAQEAKARTKATVQIVSRRTTALADQAKAQATQVTLPKIPVKGLAIGAAVLVVAIGAGWWFTRAPAPHAVTATTVAPVAPVTVAPSTPASVTAPVAVATPTPQPAPASTTPVAPVAVVPAPAPVAPPARAPVPAPVAATPRAPVVASPTPVTQGPLQVKPVKSPSPEEIQARWAQAVKVPKPVKKATAPETPQYEKDADAALNAWQKSH